MVKLSILDYAQIDEARTAYEAIQDSVKLAQAADKLGYTRFWVAEHHDVPAFASSSPEVLMMHLADQTQAIRIGSGGVMLPHYSPLKIAENFRLLEAAHPGRIDLGMGNTLGTRQVNAALNENKQKVQGYRQSLSDLNHYLGSRPQVDFRYPNLTARPLVSELPEMFLLSTSERNAKLAGELGIGYCYGMFPYASGDKLAVGSEAFQVYRDHFQASKAMPEPRGMFALFAAIGATQEEAEDLAQAIDLWMLAKDDFAYYSSFPSVETAKAYQASPSERQRIADNRSRIVVGTPETIKDQLEVYRQAFQADEILLCTIMPSIEARIQAITILAEAYQLEGRHYDSNLSSTI
ncbi:LLM class flavin-dependent oxidoreductase [Hutsoniella sourekii]